MSDGRQRPGGPGASAGLLVVERHGLQDFATRDHLVGRAVCADPVDARHRDLLPDRTDGDSDGNGDAEGVRHRAAEELEDAARAALTLGVDVVVGAQG